MSGSAERSAVHFKRNECARALYSDEGFDRWSFHGSICCFTSTECPPRRAVFPEATVCSIENRVCLCNTGGAIPQYCRDYSSLFAVWRGPHRPVTLFDPFQYDCCVGPAGIRRLSDCSQCRNRLAGAQNTEGEHCRLDCVPVAAVIGKH